MLQSSLICGDFNGHNPLWDQHQPQDSRGEAVHKWIIDNELHILNIGDRTRESRITGNPSAPDVSLCGRKWYGKCTWNIEEDIGGSDHLPIMITLNNSVTHQSVTGKTPRWKSNGVEWTKFADAIEESISEVKPEESLTTCWSQFGEVLRSAGLKHVGKVKPGKKTKPWLTPKVRAAVKNRNALRRKIKWKRREWLAACATVREEIQAAQTQSWQELLSDAVDDVDERKMWSFVKSLNGTPDNNAPNEVLKVNGEVISSNRKKADLFASHYAKVSSHKFDKDERTTNRDCKKLLKSPTVPDKSCVKFSMRELKRAIARMKPRGAPGPDDLPPSFFKALGPLALEKLLEIFNRSFETGFCPQSWRNAVIVPLLKAGKSPSALESFRPVSLTSCGVKILERMIAERLNNMAEENGWFSKLQSGFRHGRSCEDQITRIVQAIEDGFQQKKMNRSVLVLLDFSKAYDMVWREKLLITMAEKGVPIQFLRWLNGFLQNRQANVRFCNVLSKTVKMKQGLPQGSVLSPILFLFYINVLAELLPDSLVSSLFADDVSFLATDRDGPTAAKKVQEAVDIVIAWSKKWKLSLNAGKSECCYFTTWTQESYMPVVKIDGQPIPYKKHPRLLGVLLDRYLSFVPQVEHVLEECTKKLRLLSLLAHSEWGWRLDDLQIIDNTLIRSKMFYAAAAWMPYLSDSRLSDLNRFQNKVMRTMTGQLSSSPIEAVRAECGVPSMRTCADRACLLSVEKARRMPADHPRRVALESAVPRKKEDGKRQSWYSRGQELSRKLPENAEYRLPLPISPSEPWCRDKEFELFPEMPGVKSRDDDVDNKREASIKRIDELRGDIVIYTDGSADAGCARGGSAAVVTMGDAAYPEKIDVIRRKGAAHTSSYEEECQAMGDALTWTAENCDHECRVVICTDSQSLCKALAEYSESVDSLRVNINVCRADICIQWVPGHSNIPGNDMADEEAKLATDEEGPGRAVSIKGIKPVINATINDGEITHTRTRQVYSGKSRAKDKEQIRSRSDATLLRRLRTGHHFGFKTYQHRLNPNEDPTCPRCKELAKTGPMQQPLDLDSVEHWLECPATVEARMRIYGRVEVGADILTKEPRNSAALARSTLRGAQWGGIATTK